MGDNTKIEWCDATWNPIRGCSRVSQGCVNCYAEAIAARFSGPGQAYHGIATRKPSRWTNTVVMIDALLDQPMRWKKPRRIFANSMSDPFHDGLADDDVARLWAYMMGAYWHTLIVLTKRPARARALLTSERFRDRVMDCIEGEVHADAGELSLYDPLERHTQDWRAHDFSPWPAPNIWLGVSVEDQAAADERIPQLLDTPATVRFLSCEPLLGPVHLEEWLDDYGRLDGDTATYVDVPKTGLDWVIAGGESGTGARPMHPDWARGLRDQCADARVPFFFKQWGEWYPGELVDDGSKLIASPDCEHDPEAPNWEFRYAAFQRVDKEGMLRVGKKLSGRLLDGAEHMAFPS